MKFLIVLPILFISIILLEVGKFAKFKLLEKIAKLFILIAIIFFLVEYAIYIDFDINNIKLF